MTATTNSIALVYERNRTAIWLLLICVFAAVLRFRGLTFQSYWYDELFSAYISNPANSFTEVARLTLADVHPPFYQLVMWLSYRLFGYTEWAGRLPSVLAGIATVPAMFFLARELFDSRTGLYAAALAAPNYYLVYYAQEARSYAFLYLLCCLSFLFFIYALRRSSWVWVFAYVAATVALVYTHYFGFILLAAQGLTLLAYGLILRSMPRDLLLRAGVAVAGVVLAVAPLTPFVLGHASIEQFWIPQPPVSVFFSYFVSYFASVPIAVGLAMLCACGGLVTVMGYLQASKLQMPVFGVLALVLWIGIGYLMPWGRGLVGQPVITDRNTIMLVPPILILAALGLRCIPWARFQALAALATVAVTTLHLTNGLNYYTQVKKNQYRQMARQLEDYAEPLPIYALKLNDTKYNVYFEQIGSVLRAQDVGVLEERLAAGSAEPLFWLADGHKWTMQTDIRERYGLITLAHYEHYGTVAELLGNPRYLERIDLQPVAAADGKAAWKGAAALEQSPDADQLVVAMTKAARIPPLRPVTLRLTDSLGAVRATYAAELGDMPGTLQVKLSLPPGAAFIPVVETPSDMPEPELWLVKSATPGN